MLEQYLNCMHDGLMIGLSITARLPQVSLLMLTLGPPTQPCLTSLYPRLMPLFSINILPISLLWISDNHTMLSSPVNGPHTSAVVIWSL